jgi:hypothetical protein
VTLIDYDQIGLRGMPPLSARHNYGIDLLRQHYERHHQTPPV